LKSLCLCVLKNTSTMFTTKTERKLCTINRIILHNCIFVFIISIVDTDTHTLHYFILIFFVSIVDAFLTMRSIKRWGISTWMGEFSLSILLLWMMMCMPLYKFMQQKVMMLLSLPRWKLPLHNMEHIMHYHNCKYN